METEKEKRIECELKNNKWSCSIDSETKEVAGIITNDAHLFDKGYFMYLGHDEKCHSMIDKYGNRELVCVSPIQFQRIKEIYHLTEEKE